MKYSKLGSYWIKIDGSMIRVDSIVEFNPQGWLYTSAGKCHLLNKREIEKVKNSINFIKP